MAETVEMNPLRTDGLPIQEISLDFCNERSRLLRNDENESSTFFFDYSGSDGSSECINWRNLRDLKLANKWGVIRHPFILNYLNQKLISCAIFYTAHIMAYFSFLILLSWHIFSPTFSKDCLVTLYVALFVLFMLIKYTNKALLTKTKSLWYLVPLLFNIVTYIATLGYVWFPVLANYDDFNQEIKKIFIWFLPIVAIISAWANFLYILRKSPFGIYIFMMTRILRSFGHIATIWFPTLIAFSFAFHLIMKDTGIKPWDTLNENDNISVIQKWLIVLQAVTKTSTMMIGEVDANDILDTNQWIPSVLVLTFEIITVILLMNLMVSLAVGDVSDLKSVAHEKLLKIKVNFVVESLQMSEQLPQLSTLHLTRTRNVLVVFEDGSYYNSHEVNFPRTQTAGVKDETFKVNFTKSDMRLRIRSLHGTNNRSALLRNCVIECVETPESRIPILNNDMGGYLDETTNCDSFKQWIIGIDWMGFLDL